MSNYKLEAKKLTKEYPGTIALDDFSTGFTGGRVHTVIGKNGSGKSTLMKLFSGAIAPTKGEVYVDGEPVVLHSPLDAFKKGIAMVYQELSLIPDMTVAENIFLNRYPDGNSSESSSQSSSQSSSKRKKEGNAKKLPFIRWKNVYKEAADLLESMNIELDVHEKVSRMSVGKQQIIEIAKAMSFNPSVLILDEPTSALARHETQALFSLIKRLKQKGVAILYITHRLQELSIIGDTVTVIRDGKLIGTREIKDVTSRQIVDMMFGNVEQKNRPTDLKVSDEVVLQVEKLSRKGLFQDVSFSLKRGEVLGIAGMLGAGRSELLRSIFGADPFDSGEIHMSGKKILYPEPGKMRDLGLAMTPENRKSEGLVQSMSIRQNMCMASMDRIAAKGPLSKGFITQEMEKAYTKEQIQRLEIKLASEEDLISSLSGGNQQKVVIGNWLNTKPQIVFFDEPSRGIDVNAKQQIFQIMWDLSRDNLSCVFVSTELEELLEVCHRILIMKQGKIVEEVYPENIGLEELYARCMEE